MSHTGKPGRPIGSGHPLGLGAKARRNLEIVRRYLAKESIGVLAEEYGVSRQRIGQICQRANAQRPHLNKLNGKDPNAPTTVKRRAAEARSVRRKRYLRLRAEAVDAMRREGATWRVIAEILGESEHCLQRTYYTHKKGEE